MRGCALLPIIGLGFIALWLTGFRMYSRPVSERGLYAPAYDGKGVTFIERSAKGRYAGLGLMYLTPPGMLTLERDNYRLRHLDLATGNLSTLDERIDSPLVGTKRSSYSNSMFGSHHGLLRADNKNLSGYFALANRDSDEGSPPGPKGGWRLPVRDGKFGEWTEGPRGTSYETSTPLRRGNKELVTLFGPRGNPGIILEVEWPSLDARILVEAPGFRSGQHEKGLRRRELCYALSRTVTETAEAFGHLPEPGDVKVTEVGGPDDKVYDRMRAEKVPSVPAGVRVFDIPQEYMDVGLFTRLAEAFAIPGEAVAKEYEGTTYYDDDVGPQLQDYLEEGHNRFGVNVDGQLWLVTLVEYERIIPKSGCGRIPFDDFVIRF